MKSKSVNELILKIDELFQIHLSQRGILQYVSDKHVGQNQISWGSKVTSSWFDITFKFQNTISETTRSELNRISEYMNQNFIVRLHALLEYEGIKDTKSKIDIEISGHEILQILHELRKEFAHKTGKFNPENKDSVRLRHRLFKTFDINSEESLPDQFPLDKNRVIKPIVDGIKLYINGYWEKYRT